MVQVSNGSVLSSAPHITLRSKSSSTYTRIDGFNSRQKLSDFFRQSNGQQCGKWKAQSLRTLAVVSEHKSYMYSELWTVYKPFDRGCQTRQHARPVAVNYSMSPLTGNGATISFTVVQLSKSTRATRMTVIRAHTSVEAADAAKLLCPRPTGRRH